MVRHCFESWENSDSAECLSSFFIPDLHGKAPYFPTSNAQSTFLFTFIFTIPFFLLMVLVAAWPYRLCGLRGLLRRALLAVDVFGNSSGDPSKGGVSVAGGIVTLGVALLALFFCAYTILSSFSAHNEILTPAPNAAQSSLSRDVTPHIQFFFEWWFVPLQGSDCSQVCNSLGGSNMSNMVCGLVSISLGYRCQATWLSPLLSTQPLLLAYNSSGAFETTQTFIGSYVHWEKASGDNACYRQFQSIAADDTLLFSSYSKSNRDAPLRTEARFRRLYFDVDSTLARDGVFSSMCFADGALFDSFNVPSSSLSNYEIFTLQITSEAFPQMAVLQSTAFTLAAAIFSILGAAVGLIRPVTSSWHYAKGCARKFPRLQLIFGFVIVAVCLGLGFGLQFGYAVKSGLFQNEFLLFYIFIMSVGLAALVLWIAHATHHCQTSRARGWSTQAAPLLSP